MSFDRMQDRLQAQCRLDTPLGPMVLAATTHGLAGAWFDGQAHHPGPLAAPDDASHPHLQAGALALRAYWDSAANGKAPDVAPALPAVPAVMLDLHGTAFQQAVWAALQAIAPGSTCGYGVIARRIGRPAAVRAVGAAIGRNPVSVLVPCHRVLRAGGALTGYAGGLARKRALLLHEGAIALDCA
jgi:methylated-DNA-[protein]-cysteine S-methyltransferase